MSEVEITFVGGGNMAGALIGGLLRADIQPAQLAVVEPNDARAEQLAEQGVITSSDADAVPLGEVLVLAVKPQVLQAVCRRWADRVQERNPLIISIAAGIRTDAIEKWLGGGLSVARAMPNTPALVAAGATGLYAADKVSKAQREQTEQILRAVGTTVWVDDELQLDAVTALSGSGPAYYFRFMEAQIEAGMSLGLDAETARRLTLETALGAAKLAAGSSDEPAQLRRNVTSPGGTTEAALVVLDDGGIGDLIQRAMVAANRRADELANELAADDPEGKL